MSEKVAIVKTAGNDTALLRNAVQNALDLLDSPLKDVGPGDAVVIKPNITADSISWRQGIVTNPHLVRAIIEIVAERNPREILIAEAIAVGLDVKKAYSYLGYDKIAKDTGARLVDLYDEVFVDVPVTGSNLHSTLQIAKTIIEADFLIKHAAECVQPPEGIECTEGGACAACSGVIELALARAGQMELLGKLQPLRIVCGPDSSPPGAAENVLVVGKCISHLKESGHFVPGCPPPSFSGYR